MSCSFLFLLSPYGACVCETRYHIRFSLYFTKNCRGAEGTCKALPNEALCKHPRKHVLIIRVYLPSCDHLLFRVCFQFHVFSFRYCHGYRLSPEPARRFTTTFKPNFILRNLFRCHCDGCTVFAICQCRRFVLTLFRVCSSTRSCQV